MKKQNNKIFIKNNFIIIFAILKLVMLISCDFKNKPNKFKNDDFNFKIHVPLTLNKEKDNIVKILNYSSKFDSIKFDRYPIVYLFIEDTIVSEKSNILKLTSNKEIKFAEFYVYDGSFKIPNYLFENKKGKHKLSIAILDIILKDTLKANVENNFKEDQINMSILECTTNYDIYID